MTPKFRLALLASAGGAAIALASPAQADATVDCNVGTGSLSTECGIAATSTGEGSQFSPQPARPPPATIPGIVCYEDRSDLGK